MKQIQSPPVEEPERCPYCTGFIDPSADGHPCTCGMREREEEIRECFGRLL